MHDGDGFLWRSGSPSRQVSSRTTASGTAADSWLDLRRGLIL